MAPFLDGFDQPCLELDTGLLINHFEVRLDHAFDEFSPILNILTLHGLLDDSIDECAIDIGQNAAFSRGKTVGSRLSLVGTKPVQGIMKHLAALFALF